MTRNMSTGNDRIFEQYPKRPPAVESQEIEKCDESMTLCAAITLAEQLGHTDRRITMRRRFNALAASHGAASVGSTASFAIAGTTVLAEPTDPSIAIGSALLVIATIYFVAMMAIGKLAETGGFLDRHFNFRAGFHGTACFCFAVMLACLGVLTLSDLWSSLTALGLALLTVSFGCAVGTVSWGLIGNSSADDESKLRE